MKKKFSGFPDPEIPSIDETGHMIPPWDKYPNLEKGSMGWRMGMGEAYIEEFQVWYLMQLRPTQIHMMKNYPEPEEWKGFYRGLKAFLK